jgi:Ca-activated chloride channel homolog
MSLRLLRFALIVILGFMVANQQVARPGQGSGQQAKPPAGQLPPRVSDQTYRVNVDLVNMLCSVWDKNTNAFVTNLVKEDFTVLEDDQKQEIRNFIRETNMALTIAFLIDTSSSVAPKLKFEQEAAISFFHSVLRDQDRAMLVEFDSGISMVQDFTSDPNKLAKGIRSLKAAGGTALYDAIYHVCDEKLIRETGRKAIVILSDGDDTSSKMAFEPALEMALRAETIIFAISTSRGGYFGVSSDTPGDKLLKRFAEETGGQAIYPFKIEELEDSFRQINQELRSQYSLGYLSKNPKRDGTYRKVEIKVAEKGLRLNYRKGYYAPTS